MFDDIIKKKIKIIHVTAYESGPHTDGKIVKVPNSEYDEEITIIDGEVISRKRLNKKELC